MTLPQITINIDPKAMAVVAAIASAGLVAGVGVLAQVLGSGRLDINSSDIARILAAALSGAIAAYVQSNRPGQPAQTGTS